MNDDSIDALMRAARRVDAGEPLTNELLAAEGVPVALRLVLAAGVLTAADRPVNKKSVTAAAPAARSAAYREHAALLDDAVAVLPALVRAQLDSVGVAVSAVDLAAQLARANEVIAHERALRRQAEDDLAHVAAYARELHWAAKPAHDEMLRERREKVRPLRPVEDISEPERP